MRRPAPVVLLSAVIAAAVVFVPGASPAAALQEPQPAGSQEGVPDAVHDTDAGEDDEPVGTSDIVLKPDSGRPPEDAGDRGGALQVVVFLAILAGVGAIALKIYWETTGNRRRTT